MPGDGAMDRIAEPPAAYIDGRQADLFAPRATLSRDLACALAAGAFDEAWRLRAQIEQEYGTCAETRELGFLERLELALQPGASLAEALETWNDIDAALAPTGALRLRIRQGLFARLLESYDPQEIAEASARCLPVLTEILGAGDEMSDGRRRARALVRDALLANTSLAPLDFSHDPPLAELLAEDLEPGWLACLGAVRRLWSAPRVDVTRATVGASLDDRPSEEQAAWRFWGCLGVADDPSAPEDARRQARRRMKELDAELHGRYMCRARPLRD
jgi:hypothetical protein